MKKYRKSMIKQILKQILWTLAAICIALLLSVLGFIVKYQFWRAVFA